MRNEATRYKKKWQTINLNTFVEKFAKGSKGVVSKNGRKIYYYNKTNNLRITTDVAGGYCRLENISKRGKDARNYINARGKIQGRTVEQFEKLIISEFKKEMN